MKNSLFKWVKLKLRAKRLRSSSLFDSEWYVQNNDDVDFSRIEPAMHWLEIGWTEDRNPHRNFDSNWYLSRNPDVQQAGFNPLEHYLKFGAKEGRDPHPAFLTSWYIRTYPDAADAGLTPYEHYHLVGIKKGYKPHPEFDSIKKWKFSMKFGPKSKARLFRKLNEPENSQLTIGFAVSSDDFSSTAGDLFTAKELSDAVTIEFGWKTRFLSREGQAENWYDVAGLDFLIVMIDDYDLEKIYGYSSGLVTIAWMRNWFEKWVNRPWIKQFDLTFCSSETAKEYVKSETGLDTAILRLASNPQRFNLDIEPEEVYKSDYCFTGNYWGSDREIEKIDPSQIPYDFALFGSGWAHHEQFNPFYKGTVPYNQINRVYASSHILLDDANHATRKWGSVNSRVFDGLLSGILVITNGEIGATEIFKDKLPTYGSAEELQNLLTHFIEHPDQKTELVKTLRNEVLRDHTYTHRAHELRKAILDYVKPGNRIAIKVPVPRNEEAENWGDFHMAKGLAKALNSIGYITRTDLMKDWYTDRAKVDDLVIVIRGLSRYQPDESQINFLWLISHPEKVLDEELELFDHVFVASKTYTRELKSRLKTDVSELLQCTDPQRFRIFSGIKKNQNVVFVGNSRKTRRPIVYDAIKAGLNPKIYGNDWEGLIDSKFIAGLHIPNEKLGEFYAASGVVLNDHWESMKDYGFISNRIFDGLACGAKVVSDSVANLDEIFEGTVYIYTAGPDDLKSQVNRALHEGKDVATSRVAIARMIAREHTFIARAKEISRVQTENFK